MSTRVDPNILPDLLSNLQTVQQNAENADDADPYQAMPAQVEQDPNQVDPINDPFGMQLPTDEPTDPNQQQPGQPSDDQEDAEDDDAAENATAPAGAPASCRSRACRVDPRTMT